MIKNWVYMCKNFKFESELNVSFCLSGSSLHEDHQVYVYVSTFYQLINSHIKPICHHLRKCHKKWFNWRRKFLSWRWNRRCMQRHLWPRILFHKQNLQHQCHCMQNRLDLVLCHYKRDFVEAPYIAQITSFVGSDPSD